MFGLEKSASRSTMRQNPCRRFCRIVGHGTVWRVEQGDVKLVGRLHAAHAARDLQWNAVYWTAFREVDLMNDTVIASAKAPAAIPEMRPAACCNFKVRQND